MRLSIRGIGAALAVCTAFTGRPSGAAEQTPLAEEILRACGIQAGLCVRLDTTDGRLEVGLTSNGRMLVHGLALSDASVQNARATIRAAGLYGLASVERAATLDRLPYADNLVNLLVADLNALGQKAPPDEEILRVICPGGMAYTKHGGKWTSRRKPRPQQIDDWTHFDYGPEGNGVSHDRLVRPPRFVQWISEVQPLTMKGHPSQWLPFFAGLRVAGGRVVFAWGTRGPRGWETCYTGRDAFNGIPLWSVENHCFSSWKDRQLIAEGDRVYTFLEEGGPPVALDAATGEVVLSYQQAGHLPKDTSLVAVRYCRGRLIQTCENRLYVLDARTGRLQWTYTETEGNLLFPSATAEDDRLFAAVAPQIEEGSSRWPVAKLRAIVCLELSTGKPLWRNSEVAGGAIGQLVYSGGHLALFGSGAIGGGKEPYVGNIRVDDGKLLWHTTFKTNYNRFGYNLLVRDGVMYYADAWRVYAVDPQTGEETRPYELGSYNQRCNRFSATDDFLIFGLVTYVDRAFAGHIQSITRSQCATGTFPANGMVYFVPNGCGCIAGQLRGHMALSPEPLRQPVPDPQRLERGPAGSHGGAVSPDRKTPGLPGSPVAEDMVRQRRAAGLETSPVLVDGKSYVAVIHQHRLECRDSDGKILWSYTVGGRISAPPVVHEGLCLFGSHDGWVYCLRAADGALRWRFMAAPYERKMVAHSQLESSWPVYGVTLHRGLVCFSAGLHPELGGGIYVYGLEPESGKLVWRRVLQSPGVVHKGTTRTQVAPNRILNDVLESDGERLSLPGVSFDPDQPDATAESTLEAAPLPSKRVRRGE